MVVVDWFTFHSIVWFVIYGDASHYGMNDLKGSFHPAKFYFRLIASIQDFLYI